MLTPQQIHNAYQDAGLDSYPCTLWMKLKAKERDEQIEELVKALYLRHTGITDVPLTRTQQALFDVWQQQTTALGNFYLALNFTNPGAINAVAPQVVFIDREEQARENARHAAEILVSYTQHFGTMEATRLQYWPAASFIMQRYQFDLVELNDWLQWFSSLPQQQRQLEHNTDSKAQAEVALVA